MTLVVLVTLAVGVKVAVQVTPPSLLLTALRVPLDTVRSALLKPTTVSEKVMVTCEVWPMIRESFATTTVAVGRTPSMATLFDVVLPLPALPAMSWTPVLSRVMWLLALTILAVGVKVAVQVVPPSLLLTALRVPLDTIRSALVNPVTASLKVMVTSEVWPMPRLLLANTTVAVGRTVSTA